jgi:UDP:flavonoid glycosyltransferase YjiC (YdhE family)
MRRKHITFCVEQAYGHVIPTLGISLELMRRGYRVSYAASPSFAAPIRRCGAEALVFLPLDARSRLCQRISKHDGTFDFDTEKDPRLSDDYAKLVQERTQDSLTQLERLYEGDRPDVIVHDDCLDTAARSLAVKWNIAKVRFVPTMMRANEFEYYPEDQLVLVTVPRFFNDVPDDCDDRFHFVGFMPEGRDAFFEPWERDIGVGKIILVSSTTGLLPQVEFCRLAIDAFRDQTCSVVLSVAGGYDPISDIGQASTAALPENFVLNRASSNLEILKCAGLFVGQGGQGSTLEAVYCGVPSILVSPSQFHDVAAGRVAKLGLGIRLPLSETSSELLRATAASLMNDTDTLIRVRLAQKSMHEDKGAEYAANLIERHIAAHS